MIPSVLCNLAIVALVVLAVLWHWKRSEHDRRLFRYFTVLSNLLCAAAATVVLIAWTAGALPTWVLLLKFVGTAAVSVTLLTVVLFLGPTSKQWKGLFSGPDLFLHLICPVLAIISYCAWEHVPQPFPTVLWAVLPVALYGAVYLYQVIYAPGPRRWPDFYGFNKSGKWPISFACMVIGAFFIGLALWAI